MGKDPINNLVAPTAYMWRGRNIEDLSREELLVIVHYLGKQVESSRDDLSQTLRMWELCRKAVK